jgi:two-component system, response regulator PdtaR
LEILRKERPDVAVLDISLRERELVTPVAQALRNLNIPFVITSAYRAGHFRSEILDDAPQVGKPTDGRQLLLALKELTAGQRGPDY